MNATEIRDDDPVLAAMFMVQCQYFPSRTDAQNLADAKAALIRIRTTPDRERCNAPYDGYLREQTRADYYATRL